MFVQKINFLIGIIAIYIITIKIIIRYYIDIILIIWFYLIIVWILYVVVVVCVSWIINIIGRWKIIEKWMIRLKIYWFTIKILVDIIIIIIWLRRIDCRRTIRIYNNTIWTFLFIIGTIECECFGTNTKFILVSIFNFLSIYIS